MHQDSVPSRLGYGLLNWLQAIFVGAWSVFWISIALLASVFDGHWPLLLARKAWGPGLLWGAGVKLSVQGLENIDPATSYIFVMNHQSMIDIPVAFAALPCDLKFVAKRILGWVPFLGFYMRRTGMILVDRKNPLQAYESLSKGVLGLTRGASILSYAEGTRSTEGQIGSFKKGPFIMAVMAQLPVIPVAIEGTLQVLPSKTFAVRPGRVQVSIGKPISTVHLGVKDVSRLRTQVRGQLIALHRAIGGAGGMVDSQETDARDDSNGARMLAKTARRARTNSG